MVLLRFVLRILGLISTVILARLLTPEDFGVVALAMVFIAVIEILGTFSFDMALIQNQEANRHHYNAVWTLEVIKGVTSGFLVWIFAEYISVYFGEPRLVPILHCWTLILIMDGLRNVGVVAFRKEMNFNKEFQYQLIIKIGAFIVTVFLAWQTRNYWALVLGTLAGRTIGLVASYALHPYRPRFSLVKMNEIVSFSSWLFINNILVFMTNKFDDLVIGKLLGAEKVGVYTVAYEISNLPTTELIFPISRAVFPGFSILAKDIETLKQHFFRIQGVIFLVVIPVGVLISICSESLVAVLLGPQWKNAVPVVAILALSGSVRACGALNGSVFIAMGHPKTTAIIGSIRLFMLIPLLLWFISNEGIVGAAKSHLIVSLLMFFPIFILLCQRMQESILNIIYIMFRPLLGSICMIVAAHFFILPLVDSFPHISRLLWLLLSSVAVYILTIGIAWWITGNDESAELKIYQLIKERTVGKLM